MASVQSQPSFSGERLDRCGLHKFAWVGIHAAQKKGVPRTAMREKSHSEVRHAETIDTKIIGIMHTLFAAVGLGVHLLNYFKARSSNANAQSCWCSHVRFECASVPLHPNAVAGLALGGRIGGVRCSASN
jgi:hypothetical protein